MAFPLRKCGSISGTARAGSWVVSRHDGKANMESPTRSTFRSYALGVHLLTHRGLGLGAVFVWLMTFVLDPVRGLGLPCLFARFFALSCPGCGLTRSMIAISHGHWSKAFQYHPFGFFVYFFCLWFLFFLLVSKRKKSQIREVLQRKHRVVHVFLAVVSIAFVGFGLLRPLWQPRLPPADGPAKAHHGATSAPQRP